MMRKVAVINGVTLHMWGFITIPDSGLGLSSDLEKYFSLWLFL